MVITAATALELLPILVSILGKTYSAIKTGKPQNIEEEINRLNAARLKTSDEIIAEADAGSGD